MLTRSTAAGSQYLAIVCLLPEIMRPQLGTSFHFGGTSLLIAVVVVMDLRLARPAPGRCHSLRATCDGFVPSVAMSAIGRALRG
ncbi:hypothetical protein J2Y70_004320 [Xanthomonas translucens]|nr:hypothetical protein [Xanthomonas translucens]